MPEVRERRFFSAMIRKPFCRTPRSFAALEEAYQPGVCKTCANDWLENNVRLNKKTAASDLFSPIPLLQNSSGNPFVNGEGSV
jgi:hypothetical protein